MKSTGPTLTQLLSDTARAFRLGMEGEANEHFTGLIDALGHALQDAPAENLSALSLLLPEILAAQHRQDYLNIADLLEYRLAPLLGLG
jgi:hypothetical protein